MTPKASPTLVPRGAVTKVEAFAEGYFFETQMLKALPNQIKPVEMLLKPALPGEKADIQNMYFVGGKAILLKSSEPESSIVVTRSMMKQLGGPAKRLKAANRQVENAETELARAQAELDLVPSVFATPLRFSAPLASRKH